MKLDTSSLTHSGNANIISYSPRDIVTRSTTEGVTADILKETATAVMEETQIREKLRKIQEEIACAPDNVGAVGIIETDS